jgi:hypothetical protein
LIPSAGDGDAKKIEDGQEGPDVAVAQVFRGKGDGDFKEAEREEKYEGKKKGEGNGFELDAALKLVEFADASNNGEEPEGEEGDGQKGRGDP